jgi:ABC-type nitrate/sulfonate/bicarbonate transport system permease component
MDWLMTIEVIGGVILAFAGALAVGLWLSDVRVAQQGSDPPLDNP